MDINQVTIREVQKYIDIHYDELKYLSDTELHPLYANYAYLLNVGIVYLIRTAGIEADLYYCMDKDYNKVLTVDTAK